MEGWMHAVNVMVYVLCEVIIVLSIFYNYQHGQALE